jgi:hypothetical protein
MNKKHGLLFGFAVIAIAAVFTQTGCPTEADDDGGGGGSVSASTIKLAQAGANTFTVTLTGVKWLPQEDLTASDLGFDLSLLLECDGDVIAANADEAENPAIGGDPQIKCTVVRNSDTVVTVTMSQFASSGKFY